MALNPFSWIGPLALPRLALLLNHIVASEPQAMARLKPHAGRHVDLRWASDFMPPLAAWLAPGSTGTDWLPLPVRLSITPAGLFEVLPLEAAPLEAPAPSHPPAQLTLTVQLPAPWTLARRALLGERPEVNIEGDAALAEVASWLMKNLRWDLEDDAARWLGSTPSQMLRTLGGAVKDALQRWRPGAGAPSFGDQSRS